MPEVSVQVRNCPWSNIGEFPLLILLQRLLFTMEDKKCIIVDCEEPASDGHDKCEHCRDVSDRLARVWKQKTEEVVVDEDL